MRLVGVNVTTPNAMEKALRTEILATAGGAAGLTGAFLGVGSYRDARDY